METVLIADDEKNIREGIVKISAYGLFRNSIA